MVYLSRRLEDILDAFADRISKPRLFLTDKMQIALGKLTSYFALIEILNLISKWDAPYMLFVIAEDSFLNYRVSFMSSFVVALTQYSYLISIFEEWLGLWLTQFKKKKKEKLVSGCGKQGKLLSLDWRQNTGAL